MKKTICMMLIMAIMLSSAPNMALGAEAGPENGRYYILQGNKCVNIYAEDIEKVKNNTKINMYSFTEHDTQRFTLLKQSNGTYKILTQKSGYALNITSLKSGAEVICYKDTKRNTEYFIIEPVGAGYAIRVNNAPELAITVKGSELVLKKYIGSKNQIFEFKGVKIAGNPIEMSNQIFEETRQIVTDVENRRKIQSPVESRYITSPFQPYYRQDYKDQFAHAGVDYKSSEGSLKISAFYQGEVTKVAHNKSAGYYVEIEHDYYGKTFYSYYFHLKKNSVLVKEGDEVDTGQHIATMGTTGASTGVHLHFQITDTSVVNSDGSLHTPKNDSDYKGWSKQKQSKVESFKSVKKTVFYNPETVLEKGLSVIK